VNELASKSYSANPQQVYAEGSIIVREKRAYPDANKPQLLAVMIKREKGFNPAANDWLFLTVDGGLAKVKARTKKGACLGCHEYARARDFVFELK
jgi:hypothetical protein